MLTCRDVTKAIASDELLTAGWRRRAAVRLHLLMCRNCRSYEEQIQVIGKAAQTLFGQQEGDVGTLERLESEILEHLQGAEANGPELEH